jgi:hypothetical protein
LKASLNPLNLKIHLDMMKYPQNYLKLAMLILPHLWIKYVIHPFYHGLFLNAQHTLIVKLLLKKGDRMDVSNYRPISILTSFSKILETVIYNRLLEHDLIWFDLIYFVSVDHCTWYRTSQNWILAN